MIVVKNIHTYDYDNDDHKNNNTNNSNGSNNNSSVTYDMCMYLRFGCVHSSVRPPLERKYPGGRIVQ